MGDKRKGFILLTNQLKDALQISFNRGAIAFDDCLKEKNVSWENMKNKQNKCIDKILNSLNNSPLGGVDTP